MPKEMPLTLETVRTQIPDEANIPPKELSEMVDVVCVLLEQNKSTPLEEEAMKSLDSSASMLFRFAAAQGELGMVKKLLNQKSSLLALTQGESGISALHYAARMGHLEVVKYLLEFDTAQVAQFDSERKNVLSYAALSGNVELLQWFLENREDDFRHEDQDGGTVLNDVAFEGTLELFEWFMEHSPRDLVNELGGSLLINCIYSEELEKVKYMVKYLKQNLIEAPTDILIRASEMENFDVFKLLANYYPELLVLKDHNGSTPIHYYAEDGNSDEVLAIKEKAFEALGQIIDDIPDNKGDTPFFKALQKGNFPVAQRLIEEGNIDLEHKNKQGETALDCLNYYRMTVTCNTMKKIQDVKGEFNREAASESEDDKALFLSSMAMYTLAKGTGLEVSKTQLPSKFSTWFDKFDEINNSSAREHALIEEFRLYLSTEMEKREGFVEAPTEEAELQEPTSPKRERDAPLEERQLKRPKGGFFSEHAQKSPWSDPDTSESQEPESGPFL